MPSKQPDGPALKMTTRNTSPENDQVAATCTSPREGSSAVGADPPHADKPSAVGIAGDGYFSRRPVTPRGTNSGLVVALIVLPALVSTGFYPQLLPWGIVTLLVSCYAGVLLLRMSFSPQTSSMGNDIDVLPSGLLGWGILLLSALGVCQLILGLSSSWVLTVEVTLFWASSWSVMVWLNHGVLTWMRRRWFGVVAVLLLAAVALTGLCCGLWSVYHPVASGSPQIWWPFVYRNHFAAFLLLCLPVVLSQLTARKPARYLYPLASLVTITAVISTGSRSGVAFLLVELLLFAWFSRAQLRKISRQAIVSLVLVALALSVAIGGVDLMQYRVQHSGALWKGRQEYWQASLHMIEARPLLGWGFGVWPDVYREFLLRDNGLVVNRAHSDWLEWTAEGGLCVFVILLFLYLRSWQLAARHPWALGIPILFTSGMVDYTLRQPLIWVTMLALWLAASRSSDCLAPRYESRQ